MIVRRTLASTLDPSVAGDVSIIAGGDCVSPGGVCVSPGGVSVLPGVEISPASAETERMHVKAAISIKRFMMVNSSSKVLISRN